MMTKQKTYIEYGNNGSWEVICSKCGVVGYDDTGKFNYLFATERMEQHVAKHAREQRRTILAQSSLLGIY